MAARHIVPRVLVLERAPEHMRGGNTRHTRNIRCAHPSADQFFSAAYCEEELLEDLIGVTGGPANLDLAKFAIRQSSKLPQWMTRARRGLAAASGGHAQPGAHQSLVSGRRQSAAERLLPDRAQHGNQHSLRRVRGRSGHREWTASKRSS